MEEKKYKIVDVLMADAVDKTIKTYGLEGAEEKIKEVYNHLNMQKLKDMMLNELYRRYKRS